MHTADEQKTQQKSIDYFLGLEPLPHQTARLWSL